MSKNDIVCTNCGCWWLGESDGMTPKEVIKHLEKRGWWFEFEQGEPVMICPECDRKLKKKGIVQ